MSPISYQYPRSTDSTAWQAKVVEALSAGSLVLERKHKEDQSYTLRGECPRCNDDLQPQTLYLGDILVPDTFGGVRTESNAATVEVEIVCNCVTEHKKGAKGCGFGKGLVVQIARPKPTIS